MVSGAVGVVANVEVIQDGALRDRLRADLAVSSECRVLMFAVSDEGAALFESFLRRGGRLFALVNHPLRLPAGGHHYFAACERLRAAGARLKYQRGRALHEKLILVAPDVAYVGSHNLTRGGLRSNNEISLRVQSPALYQRLLTVFNSRVSPRTLHPTVP